MRRFLFCLVLICVTAVSAGAEEVIRWVDFQIPYESLKYAMDVDIETFEQEKHIGWIDILALAGCRTGGKCGLESVKKAAAGKTEFYIQSPLGGNITPEEVIAKVPEGADTCYVRVDQNLIWWVCPDGKNGAVEIWE